MRDGLVSGQKEICGRWGVEDGEVGRIERMIDRAVLV